MGSWDFPSPSSCSFRNGCPGWMGRWVGNTRVPSPWMPAGLSGSPPYWCWKMFPRAWGQDTPTLEAQPWGLITARSFPSPIPDPFLGPLVVWPWPPGLAPTFSLSHSFRCCCSPPRTALDATCQQCIHFCSMCSPPRPRPPLMLQVRPRGHAPAAGLFAKYLFRACTTLLQFPWSPQLLWRSLCLPTETEDPPSTLPPTHTSPLHPHQRAPDTRAKLAVMSRINEFVWTTMLEPQVGEHTEWQPLLTPTARHSTWAFHR